jgi:hypothetical protein
VYNDFWGALNTNDSANCNAGAMMGFVQSVQLTYAIGFGSLLGIVSSLKWLIRKDRKKLFAIAGLCINGILIFFFLYILIRGWLFV